MPGEQTQIQRTEIENQIKNDFLKLQKELGTLKSKIQSETDQAKKQEKEAEIKKMEEDLENMKKYMDKLSSLQDEELQSLMDRLEQYKQVKQDVQGETADLLGERFPTPTTYELLKDSMIYNSLKDLISSNPNEFANVPGDTPETKIEYIFSKIREGITIFLKNKLGDSERYGKVIDNTMAPALEWSMIELLSRNKNGENVSMLEGLHEVSWANFDKLLDGVKKFKNKAKGSFNGFSQWINAIDYLSVHNGVLKFPEKSAVLSSPVEFKNYLNDPVFAPKDENGDIISFSPYEPIDKDIFKVDENQTFEFGISLDDKQNILSQIGNKVVSNSEAVSLITKMLNRPEKFFGASDGLQKVANGLLDGVNAINSVTKLVGMDLLGEISKPPEDRDFLYVIVDFVCKLIGITGGLEGIVKRWRLDRLNLTSEKNENIINIFEEYQKLAGEGNDISITDANSCSSVLADFELTDLDKPSTTKGDYLRDVMAANIDINQIPVSVVHQTLGNDYLKNEVVMVNGKQKEKVVVDVSKITEEKKKELAHIHIGNMKTHLEKNYNDLVDFYSNIKNIDDLVICITASLYADKEDVIEGIKAQVFLPENYGVTYGGIQDVGNEGQDDGGDNTEQDDEGNDEGNSEGNNEGNSEGNNEGNDGGNDKLNNGGNNKGNDKRSSNGNRVGVKLDSTESSDRQTVSEQWMYNKIIEYGVTNKSQIAYILATAKLETNRGKQPGFKNIKESGRGGSKNYGKVDLKTGKAYYGRGFVQLTGKDNYKKYTEIIRREGKNFKNNDGSVLKVSNIDLVKDPDIILKSNDLAAFILVYGMKNGIFTGKSLDDFINDKKTDFINARQVVNGNDSAMKGASYAQSYLNTLMA